MPISSSAGKTEHWSWVYWWFSKWPLTKLLTSNNDLNYYYYTWLIVLYLLSVCFLYWPKKLFFSVKYILCMILPFLYMFLWEISYPYQVHTIYFVNFYLLDFLSNFMNIVYRNPSSWSKAVKPSKETLEGICSISGPLVRDLYMSSFSFYQNLEGI